MRHYPAGVEAKNASYNEAIYVTVCEKDLLTRMRAVRSCLAGTGEQADFEPRLRAGKQSQAMLGFGRKKIRT